MASQPETGNKKILFLVFLTVFLDLVGFGIIIPIQPFYAEKLGASPTTVTLLGASFSLMQFLFGSFWGRLSDRIGRRPVMLLSIACASLGYLIFGLADNLKVLFLARMLAGFGSANIGAAQAIIADSTPPESRAKGMGIIGAAFGLGFILGPALGGFFGQVALSLPAFVASGLGLFNFVFAWINLPETCPQKTQSTKKDFTEHRPGFSWAALKHAARHPNVPQLFLVYLLYISAFSMMEQVLGLFIEAVWHPAVPGGDSLLRAKQSAAETAYVLIMVGVTATIVQGGLIGRLVKKFGERRLLISGISIVGSALAIVPLIGQIGTYQLMLGWAVFSAIGSGLTNPSLSSLLSQSVDKDEQGGVLGMGQSLAALGRVIGPSLAGLLFERGIALPFWIGSGIVFIAVVVATFIKNRPLISSSHVQST
ncbi:MAG: MFS transporter [Proteobacteria bacterium]|nr:MFS transporter [Pseudomonadota bacterium]NBY19584.1 MFS transporter [bacterium]